MEAALRSSVCAPECRRSSFTSWIPARTEEVADTRNAFTPMFSADSQWVAFGQAGIIKKVPAAGGPVEVDRSWRRRPDGMAVGWAVRALAA